MLAKMVIMEIHPLVIYSGILMTAKKTVCLEIMLFNFDKLDKVIDKN